MTFAHIVKPSIHRVPTVEIRDMTLNITVLTTSFLCKLC